MRTILLFVALSFSLVMTAQVSQGDRSSQMAQLLSHARRLLVVTTPGWNSVDGRLQMYERHLGRWVKFSEPVPIVVAKNGMGWDPVLAAHHGQTNGPIKHEGDGRSPAGVFEVGTVFGFDEKGPTLRTYLPLKSNIECVDDVASRHYAHIVDRSSVAKIDWNSSEKMREIDVYKIGMVVNYNLGKTVAGSGSCIFLHIWRGPGRGTAGCTAMEEANLKNLVNWVADEKTVLVQLPDSEYTRLKDSWYLP